jgi:hypothetical protein
MHAPSAYFTPLACVPDAGGLPALAERLAAQLFRGDFRAPGFALVSLGPAVDSRTLRRFMIALKGVLAAQYHRRTGRHLVSLSAGRFDQQATTKFHLDGAPEESFLLLGYEPTRVRSAISLADYSRAAYDRGLTPREFLAAYNPMFAAGEQALAPYVTRLTVFDPSAAQVLLINNSSLPVRADGSTQLGVLHQATIPAPNPAERRIVNSTLLVPAADPADEPIPPEALREFLETDRIAGPSYG